MKKYKIAALALMYGLGFAPIVRAQSPWESGGFKGYDQATPSEDGNLGLQGFSLSPSQDGTGSAPVPAAPSYQQAPEPQSQLQFPVPSQPVLQTGPTTTPSASPDATAAAKKAMAAVTDSVFVLMAQQGTAALVQSSQLAQKNATSDMQQFADQIVSIYGGMQGELSTLMKKNNIPTPPSLTIPSGLDRLQDKSGLDFNKQYMQIQMQQFYMLSTAFKKEADMGQNEALKSYAASHLSMIDQQKDMVQKSYMSLIGQGGSPMGASR